MKPTLALCVILAMSLALIAAKPAPKDKDADDKSLQRTWIPTKAELGGKPMDEAVRKSITLKLDHGKYEVFVGDSPDRGTYTLDATTKPKQMSVTGTEGPNKGKTFPAIYEITKDDKGPTLRICYDLSGKKHPTEFKSAPGTKLYLVTYKPKKD